MIEGEQEGDFFIPEGDSQETKKAKPVPKKSTGSFKAQKKLDQGIKVLCSKEKKDIEELVTNDPRAELIVLHFGNGDEDDYNGLSNFMSSHGECEIHIFTGVSYGVVKFKTLESAIKFTQASEKLGEGLIANCFEIPFKDDRKRHCFFFYSKLPLNEFQNYQNVETPNATCLFNISGLSLAQEFIDEEYEMALAKTLDTFKWYPMNNRRVMHFGYDFVYGSNRIDKSKPIGDFPLEFKLLLDKINQLAASKYQQGPFDQCTVTDQAPGQGLLPYLESHSSFEEVTASINLLSGVVINFGNEKLNQKHLCFPRRGLGLFSGESRYGWHYSVASRRTDKVEGKTLFRKRRINLTFRKIKQEPCKCTYPYFCESQNANQSEINKLLKEAENREKGADKKKKNEEEGQEGEPEEFKMEENKYESEEGKIKPSDVERKYVYNTYEKIAPHFSHTRYKPWPKVSEFLYSLDRGSIVADIGCGNGKYLGVNSENLYTLGTDRAENFVEICKTRDFNFQVFSADSLRLPLRGGSVDAVISIAVIHHFSTRELRVQAIRELARAVRSGGRILVYVWAFEQDTGKKFEHQDVLVPWHLQFKYEDEEKISGVLNESIDKKQGEIGEEKKESEMNIEKTGPKKVTDENNFVDEEKKAVVYKRFYHLFKQGELEENVKEVEEVSLLSSYYDHANWCVILHKK